MAKHSLIPVIDLFAGPGGLGEGFSAYAAGRNQKTFRIALSIEKERTAHQTLLLRAFFRQFKQGHVPEDYYRLLRAEIGRNELFGRFEAEAGQAEAEAVCAELGKASTHEIRALIRNVLGTIDPWVLIGGPPCQAYSLAGRARNKGRKDYVADDDKRQTLYVDYLQTIADHWPAVFVMENVKGLLSAKLKDQHVFLRILDDLRSPRQALKREDRSALQNGSPHSYELYSLVCHGPLSSDTDLSQYTVPAENYGIPQTRHRVIILGVRDDVNVKPPPLLDPAARVSAEDVLSRLPRLRSGRSKGSDGADLWIHTIRTAREGAWLRQVRDHEVRSAITRTLDALTRPRHDRGAEFISGDFSIGYRPDWFLDERIGGVCNHSARGHMDSDLHRYLFAACYAKALGKSPVLRQFPRGLWPNHANVAAALTGHGQFGDRFRVQLSDMPATTITSHISKDGHHFIHYDPTQCRSLTVREAARLQTFPDNYFFCGPRTSQYTQVGNAVPPLLGCQIAGVVHRVLENAGLI